MSSRPSEPKTSERRLSAADKQLEAVQLRKQGHTFDEIAEKLGYGSRSGAYKAVMTALRKTLQEPADELRKLELERLDVIIKSLWPFVLKGSPRHVEVALKAMDRRAAYIGLDAPKVVEDHRTVTIQLLAEHMSEQSGLDANEIIAEAEALIAAAGGIG